MCSAMNIFPLLLFIFWQCHVAFGAAAQNNIHHTSTPIDTVLVSGDTIFIASVDQIQAIGVKNLTPRENLTIGPVADSPWCNADGKSCLKDHRPILTHVHTKILHPLPNSQLLICTSVKLGSCSTYSTKLSLISISSTPVAANSANASTVSLILPDTNRLIVAASPTADSPYRDPFPAVSMRSLPGLYVENAGDLEGEAAVFLRSAWRSSMKYIYTFAYEHFVFIVGSMTQRNGQATTRLIRFCRNDTKFVSYSEIELQCRGEDNTNYPQITAVVQNGDKLVAAFSNPLNPRKSSICVFSMPRIKLTFWYNVDRCRSGTDSIKLSHIGRDTKCVNKAHIPLDEDSCELGVGGSIELVEMSTKDIYANITSLMSIDKKALFVGTTNAQIIMLKWGDSESLEEYGRRDLGDRRTGAEVLAIHRYQDLFIAQMPYGIVVDEISTCSHLNSCAECLLSPDPLCQWCHPTQSCTIGSKCGVGVSQICPSISGIPKPAAMSVNTTGPVTFEIENLPAPHGFTYRCLFGPHYTKAVWTSSGITCASKSHENAENLELSLQTSLSTKNIVTTNFTIFDCSQFQTCSLCSTSKFDCQWCPANHKCTANSKCPSESTDKCVKLRPITIPIALGSKQKITLTGENLGTLDKSQNYSCVLQIAGQNLTSKAKIGDLNVKCSELQLEASSSELKASDLMVPMILKSSQGNIIDITNISLYSCSNMASDCSSCLSLSPNLNCGWCNSKCSHDCAPTTKIHVCDPPQILRIEPESGPVEGGTLIRIWGKDLGMSVEDVRGKIYIAGSRCDVIDYQISNMIACRVDKGTASGPIKVSVGRVSMATAESTQYYSFVKVAIFSAYPLFGPLSGGTKITLYGQHLEVGSELRITIGNLPCKVLEPRNSTSTISCITPPGIIVGKSSRVVVSIDESNVILDQMFEYRPDPTISNIYPLEMFKAGGRILQVQGQNLDVTQVAKIYLLNSFNPPFAIASELRQCQVLNSTLMNCAAPRVYENSNWRADYSRLPVGFLMDNVTSVQNLGRRLQMSVKPNPQLSPFRGIRYHQGEQPLILDGVNLNLAAEPADFKIFIGSERCYVTLVDIKQLVCSGPLKQPKPTDERGQPITGELPPVTVIIGTIRSELGLIEYSNQNNAHRLTWMIFGLLGFIILLLGIMCGIWKRRRNEKEKEYKKIQLQMENLENNVRKECKQAFAELQTNLILSPAKNSTRTAPEFMHFPHFVENLLWSDSTLTSAPSLTRTLPVTLAQFHALLSFKNFIFSIVEAAETDVSISATERSMLASLLISVLLRNFGYCTEIVLDLLRIHIARAVQNKKSELLFRNSESVVEKMLAKWLSICLYSHITPQMNSFYYLYKALQYQTEKGPVDAVTGDARYTINESRLLRETVESSTMIILVSAADCSTENEEVFEVEVHACDAICQLKQKVAAVVYRDTPYSQRPRISQFELQLKNGVKLQEVLNDRTSKGPQKLQTLADYNVIQGTWMQLIPALYTASSYRNSLADSGQSSWSSLDRVSPIYSSSKYYHLSNPSTSHQTLKKSSQNIPKSIPEVYLTRLLTSKGTVQTYVEDFLESVLYFNNPDFPPILKHFFDLLDREAAINSVSENICQQWKANGYVLRVWANFVRNPQLIFDVPHSVSMDANLSTIAQTLMDCFSFSEPILGAHSPSSRLLFAKDVAKLRPLSVDLFKRVKNSTSLGIDELRAEMVNMANDVSTCKGSSLALSELLSWVRGNGIRISQILQSSPESMEQRLPQKLSQVLNVCLETDNHIYSTISDYDLG
ncbi:unnamed protein product [Caenorhabditis angaria]|uniref:Sema domain-containing protein n=1 Tax=Caenorhabditis angaria TaxID=860376 RepID=A0A9P1IEH9_9PELO|nr:unnamed protein product [Caenorhabditis angaria]